MEISKRILVQYCELQEEAKDIRARIDKDERLLDKVNDNGVVSDSVKGTRRDGTIGHIKITGFPYPEYNRLKNMIRRRIEKLKIVENELMEAVNAVDDFISSIEKSEVRMMFRFYYLDDMTWPQVAMNMNDRFPKKKIKYTDDSCRKRHDRYLENDE